jgi:hypothetical protein
MAALHLPHIPHKKGRVMHTNTTPVFSSFQKLRHTHPDLYYSADTHRKMLNAQKQLGSKFYDLIQDKEEAYELV